jgi:hypothetical protein
MNYLHHEFEAGPEDIIEVTLDHPANVQLLDSANFEKYRQGKPFQYHGGHSKQSPMRLRPPLRGHWHLVIDLGGYPGVVRASVAMIDRVSA